MKSSFPFVAQTRRHFLALTAGTSVAALASSLPSLPALAQADDALSLDEAIAKAVGDKSVEDGSGLINLDLPQIAENGNTVPVGIQVESPMTADNYVKTVHLFAEGNPNPEVCSLHFTPASGAAKASTRIRLAKTQNIVAVAEMSDGSFRRETVEVKVTIGGCGG
jgi:sulfur-oxidizing protein SoxY